MKTEEKLLNIAFNISDSLSDKQLYLESLVVLAPLCKQYKTKMTFDDICDLIVSEVKANSPASNISIKVLAFLIENHKYQEAEGLLSIKAYDRNPFGKIDKIKTFFYKTAIKKCLSNDTYKLAETYINKYYNGLSKYQFDLDEMWLTFSDSLIEVISQCESKKLTKLWGQFSQKSFNKRLYRNVYLANKLTDAKDVKKFQIQRKEVGQYGASGDLFSFLIDAYAEGKKGNISFAVILLSSYKLDDPSARTFGEDTFDAVHLLLKLAEMFYIANNKKASESAVEHAYRLLDELPVTLNAPNSRNPYMEKEMGFYGNDLILSIIPNLIRFSSINDNIILKLIPESARKNYHEKLTYQYYCTKIYKEIGNKQKVANCETKFINYLSKINNKSNTNSTYDCFEFCVSLELYLEAFKLLLYMDSFDNRFNFTTIDEKTINKIITPTVGDIGRDKTEQNVKKIKNSKIQELCYFCLATSYIEIGDFENAFRINSLITKKKAGSFIIKQTAQLIKNITSAAHLNKFKNSMKKYFPKDAVNWLN
jgi:hypothetical protein